MAKLRVVEGKSGEGGGYLSAAECVRDVGVDKEVEKVLELMRECGSCLWAKGVVWRGRKRHEGSSDEVVNGGDAIFVVDSEEVREKIWGGFSELQHWGALWGVGVRSIAQIVSKGECFRWQRCLKYFKVFGWESRGALKHKNLH